MFRIGLSSDQSDQAFFSTRNLDLSIGLPMICVPLRVSHVAIDLKIVGGMDH